MATVDHERLNNLYNSNDYENNTSDWEDAASSYRADTFYKALKLANIHNSVNSILDVGCGSGGVLVELRKKFGLILNADSMKFHGVDLSKNAVDIAKRLHQSEGNNITFTLGSYNNSPSRYYDVVSLIHVLEHCPDMFEMLSECKKKGNYFYINVPIEVNIFYSLRKKVLVNQYIKYGHLHFFNEDFFVFYLKQNGFKLLSTVYSSDFEVKKPGFSYNLLKLLRRWIGILIGPSKAMWLLGGFSLGVLVKSSEE